MNYRRTWDYVRNKSTKLVLALALSIWKQIYILSFQSIRNAHILLRVSQRAEFVTRSTWVFVYLTYSYRQIWQCYARLYIILLSRSSITRRNNKERYENISKIERISMQSSNAEVMRHWTIDSPLSKVHFDRKKTHLRVFPCLHFSNDVIFQPVWKQAYPLLKQVRVNRVRYIEWPTFCWRHVVFETIFGTSDSIARTILPWSLFHTFFRKYQMKPNDAELGNCK